ncbi:hypothetical protein HDF19_06740 [Mucilaginibacter sp. E4BP6]|uniref:hypothetical protein n=1 Tax=Mucilaginibacter sp. E4BP6 TaxID=2723089 RepID=UPI0015CAC8F0|nr:hypothetical protein [Mucilaginibacter sp. E4BP6]NYE68427.1 hypothetical protein [Mucilaginibacter sp. E4BP6]
MKYLLIFIFILTTKISFSQSIIIITGNDAYKYIGQKVDVLDNLYDGKITSDSTAVFHMGEKTSSPRMTIIYISKDRGRKFPMDPRIVEKLQRIKQRFYGAVTGTAQAPQMIITGHPGPMPRQLGKM